MATCTGHDMATTSIHYAGLQVAKAIGEENVLQTQAATSLVSALSSRYIDVIGVDCVLVPAGRYFRAGKAGNEERNSTGESSFAAEQK